MADDSVVTIRPQRVRINVTTSVKGVKTWDVTVDGQDTGMSGDEVFDESKRLVAKLQAEYPLEVT